MSVTAKWRNKDRLAQKLRRLAPEAAAGQEQANGQSAAEMVALAKGFAPRRTGDLAESIVRTPPGSVPPAYAQGGNPVATGAWLVTAGNASVRYAGLVENGTAPHEQEGRFEGTEHPGTTAQPFFFPAYRLIRKRHRGRAARALNKSIKRVAGK